MADTTNLAVGTVIIVTAGSWVSPKATVSIKTIIGGVVYILILAFMEQGSPDLAKLFALLVFVTAIFIYAVPVFTKLGLLGGNGKRNG